MARKHLVLLNMIGALALVMIDQTVLGVILPSLQRTFMFGPVHLQWSVNAYLIALASMLMCGGWLGDKFGYFTSLRMGLALFTAASLACAYAPTGEFFITARVFQGAGAALMQPAATALVFSAYPADERGKALAHYVGAGLFFLLAGLWWVGCWWSFSRGALSSCSTCPLGLPCSSWPLPLARAKPTRIPAALIFRARSCS